MRTRTVFCSHGYIIPGKPEPWLSLEIKASRFCLKCWEKHDQTFRAHDYEQIYSEDACQYGYLNLIQYVLRDRAWYRDQDRYEFLETELRMHLLEQRALIEEAARNRPGSIEAYVRKALERKLQDLQKGGDFEIQINSVQSEVLDIDRAIGGEVTNEDDGFDTTDEARLSEQIVDATGKFNSSVVVENGGVVARSHKGVRCVTAKGIVESVQESLDTHDPLKQAAKVPPRSRKSRKKENAELVRAAILEQGHRIDAMTAITGIFQDEHDRQVSKAHKQLLEAVDGLPHDEQLAIRLRFLDGGELRNGKPRPRADILRELRINGNGSSGWTDWDLRRLEQQAVLRLRQKVKLPHVFTMRD